MKNIVTDLLTQYFIEEKQNTIILIVLSLLVSLVQANGISAINAALIDAVEHNDFPAMRISFLYFIGISVLSVILFYGYKAYQTKILTKLRQWIRTKLISVLLEMNNEHMKEMNYTKISTPITRVANTCAMMFTDVFSGLLPSLTFALIVCIYFVMHDYQLGFYFVLGNFIIFMLVLSNWNHLYNKNKDYEDYTVENEGYLTEILNNIDKIIYRGQVNSETNLFEINGNEAIDKALGFYENVESHGLLLNTTITSLVIICVWHMVNKIKNGKVSVTFFITFMTMVLLYRDKMISMVQMIPDFIEFFGRTSTMLQFFKDFGLEKLDVEKNKYQDVNLPFHQLQFVNVGFYYNGAEDNPVLKNFNLTLNTVQNKIIGITGLSGRGKSTIMKLLLKIYEIKEGTIYIDGVDVLKLQPEYIRKNITYVNQTGKLFDRKVIDNIMYGCDKSEECSKQLHHIMKYPKIQELFKDIDIFNKTSGALGENLSGGQRQVINIIGGLINPSKILILDEPTNALDGQLKKEIIQIIKEYRKNKHAILIITHDKEVYSIFNEVVAL